MKPKFKQELHRETPDIHKKQDRSKQCDYCGNEVHPRKDCPAVTASCNQCGRKGHYAKACRKPSQQIQVRKVRGDTDEMFIGAIAGGTKKDNHG